MIVGLLPFFIASVSAVLAAAAGTTTLSPGVTSAPQADFSDTPSEAKGQPEGLPGKPHPVVARLLFDHGTVAAGSTIEVGVHLEQKTGWHTYWKSPGDIGLPPKVDWTAPEGVVLTPFTFAVPARFELQGIVSYGYDEQAFHISKMTIPSGFPVGPITVQAKVSWLVCEVSCIPGGTTLQRTIEVVAAGANVAPSRVAPLFDHTRAQHPTDAAALGAVSASMRVPNQLVKPEQKQTITFEISHPSGVEALTDHGVWPAFTPIHGDQWMVNDVRLKRSKGAVQIEMDLESFAPEVTPVDDQLGGLLQLKIDGKWVRTELVQPVRWQIGEAAPAVALATDDQGLAETLPPAPKDDRSLLMMLFLAFAGGVLLNIMPCVLPVLTLKIYSLVEQKDADAQSRRVAGLAYAAGVVLSFLALGGVVIALRAVSGAQVGWGYQFQSPGYVAALATIVFVFGLSLFGVVEVPTFGATQMNQAGAKEGWLGHFLTGVFATLLATPCSAPFLGTGMGFAFTLPGWGILLFFGAAGVGLSLPLLLVAFVPALSRFLPKPGTWMETFKHLMAFTLVATTVWLVSVLAAQTGVAGAVGFLGFLAVVSMACWIVGRWAGPQASSKSKVVALLVGFGLSVAGGMQFLHLDFAEADCAPTEVISIDDLDFSTDIPWQPFSEQRVKDLAGQTVFVDFTADWCLTCKANEKAVLNTEAVREAMAAHKVVPLMADWTRMDPEISAWLRRFGRAGVPFYLVIPAERSKPWVPLPEVITKSIVIDGIVKASD